MKLRKNYQSNYNQIETLAVFGGSFDPPHIGHEKIIKTILERLSPDLLVVVPTFLNPFKNKFFLDSDKRLKLLSMMFSHTNRLVVSDFEVKQKKSVYTYETILHLKSRYKPKKTYFIIGEDNVEKLHLWHKYEELSKEVEFIVCTRKNYNSDSKHFKYLNVNIDISSTQLRDNLQLDYIPKKIQNEVKKIWKRELKESSMS